MALQSLPCQTGDDDVEETTVAAPRFRSSALRRLREGLGLTRQQLAERAGVRSGDRIGSWERSVDQPSASHVPRLARVLGVRVVDLYDVDSADPPLAVLRIAAGLTLAAMSEVTGLPYARCQRLDKGVTVLDEEVAGRLALALDVSAEQLRRAARRSRDQSDASG